MPPQMKGLTQFIVDLRNSKDLEEEHKRINLEINNIQTKFNSNSSLNGYQRKKYICKLIYIHLLGYADEIDFGLRESFDLLDSLNYTEKHLGYLSISIIINHYKNQKISGYSNDTYPTNSIKIHIDNLLDLMHPYLLKDLQSNNEDFNCLAIQFIASNFNILDVDYLNNNNNNSNHSINNNNNNNNDYDIANNTSLQSSLFLPKQYQIHESDENSGQWLEIIDIIYSLCCSPIQKPLIKKKASIALLVLLKLYPQVILSNDNWIPRLLTLIDDKDLGVVISVIPLIQFLTSLKVNFVKSIIPSISNTLYSLIIENNCPKDYFYYNTPAPWLIIKLLQLIEHFFLLTDNQESILLINDLDSNTLNNLRQVVARSIQNASVPIKGLPNRNSQSSILFQAVSLAVFLDASPEAIDGAIDALMMLLDSAETNTRYLALDALIKLTARASTFTNSSNSSASKFNDYLLKIFQLLNDKDISVRKKSLDLLYTICNPKTYNIIISKLLDYFPFADLNIRSEIAIKIAVLAEKFATDSIWYVTTMLRLLSIGGGSSTNSISPVTYVGNEVWERIIQIIVNNEDLQKKSCKLILNLLKKPTTSKVLNGNKQQSIIAGVSETLIKVAAFILGEYGHLLINDDIHETPTFQFQLLYDAYFKVSLVTRAMLLSTFLKFVIRYKDEVFIPDILDLFEVENQSLDLEIQTRAFEYLKCTTLILSNKNPELINSIIRPLPVFEKKESPLMNRLGSVQKLVGNRNRSSSLVNVSKISKNNNINTNHHNSYNTNNLNPPATVKSNNLTSKSSLAINEEDENPFNEQDTKPLPPPKALPLLRISPNWYSGYHRMLHYDAGIFYENQLIKLTYRTLKNGPIIKIKFSVINNARKTAGTDITGFSVLDLKSMTKSEDPNYVINLIEVPELTIVDKSSMEFEIKVRNVVENSESPLLNLSFKCSGSFNQLNLKIPIPLLKTLSSTAMTNLDDFKKRWLQIGDLLGIEQGESRATTTITHRYNSSNVVRLLSRLGFAVVHSTPDTFENGILVMGAGILHTVKSNYGVLTTIKSVDSVGKEFELVVRCTGGGVSEIIALTLKEIFDGKF